MTNQIRKYKRNTSGLGAVLLGAFIIALVVGGIALWAAALTWAWNLVLPYLVGAPTISFWQGLGVVVLIAALRGIFNHNGSHA